MIVRLNAIAFSYSQNATHWQLSFCYDGEGDYADVAELADALDLGSSTARCEGSSPFVRI